MFQNRNLRVLVLGAGKVGSTVADMLAENYGVHVTLADRVTPLHNARESRSARQAHCA